MADRLIWEESGNLYLNQRIFNVFNLNMAFKMFFKLSVI